MFWHSNASSYDSWIRMVQKHAIRTVGKKDRHKRQFFLGVSEWTGEPILLPENILNEHVWVTGGSGSGKSGLILAPLVSQVIERGTHSVVFIDQKGDMASFWNCFASAHAAGLPFKYFSMLPGEESFIYNHLRQDVRRRFTAMQNAELFSLASGSDYEEAYGASFFQSKNELVICNYLSNYTDPPIEDFKQMLDLLDDKFSYTRIGHADDWADASHLRGIFARLASVSSFNATPRNLDKPSAHAHAIQLGDLLRSPAVYYFKLPAGSGKNTSRFGARSVLQNLFCEAGFRSSGETVPVVVICDEFQAMVGPGIDTFLEQCRSRDLFCVLAHQSIHQLQRGNLDLLPVVQACTSTHIVVEASDSESVEYVQKRSGMAYHALTSWWQEAPLVECPEYYGNEYFRPWLAASSDSRSRPLVNVREELDYRLSVNAIHKASAEPLSAFIAIKKNGGFCNYDGFMFPMRCFFHVDKKVFDERSEMPWPTWDRPETVFVSTSNPFAPGKKTNRNGTSEAGIVTPRPSASESLERFFRRDKRSK